jgi:hypothetical protein
LEAYFLPVSLLSDTTVKYWNLKWKPEIEMKRDFFAAGNGKTNPIWSANLENLEMGARIGTQAHLLPKISTHDARSFMFFK